MEMLTLVRWLLIGLVALPQGWCCAAASIPTLAVASDPCKPRQVCCACCHADRQSEDQTHSPDASPGPAPKCQCQTNYLVKITSPAINLATQCHQSIFDYFHPLSLNIQTSVIKNSLIGSPLQFQILYCIWRC
jgi:hypothetical protein